MRNPFNLLLVALACFDTCYLTGSILESVRKCLGGASDAHTLLFPWLLYPGQMIAMTASDIMTVAIAAERYVAVHYPLDYNQVRGRGQAGRVQSNSIIWRVNST